MVISLDISELFMTLSFEFLLYFVFIGLCRLLVGLGADYFPSSFSCILYLLVGPGADDFPLSFSCILYLLAFVGY